MVKVEDIQNYGKEQFETVVASATNLQNGFHAIASAYHTSTGCALTPAAPNTRR